MASGTVKWFNAKKGYGFVTPKEEGAQDVFVHFSAIQVPEGQFKTLHEGDEVDFNLVDGQKGKEARDVKVTKAAPVQPRAPRSRPPRNEF